MRRRLLTFAEQTALIIKCQTGQINRDQLHALNLALSDETYLEQHLPRVVKWGTPLSTPDRMTILAKAVQDKRHGQEFIDPLQFLLHGDEAAVKRLLDDETDWNYVAEQRSKHQHDPRGREGSDPNNRR